jgi:RNA polymerase sigma-70 factor, ECF subfamily
VAARVEPGAAVSEPALALSIEELYSQHYEFVWRNARRLGASDEWVDDAVHETFLVAARRLHEFEQRSSPKTWLFAITVRVVDHLRRGRRRYESRLSRYAEQAPNASNPWRRDEAARLLRALLDRLDEDKRVVVILAELEGFTAAEIADALGTKRGTIETRLRKARQLLARMVAEDQQEPK